MKTSVTAATRRRLTPLACANCNAPLVVVDGPSLGCRFCGANNVVPQVYREELRLARDLDSATRNAAEQWLRFAHIKVPRWWFICAALAPFVLMTGGLMILLTGALLRVVSAEALPLLLVYLWLILIPAQLLAANVTMKNILVSGAASVGVAFAAKSPSSPGEPPRCRQCGAPLSVQPDDVLVRCIYCEAESIVQLDDSAMKTLRTRVVSAQSSLAQAMDALKACEARSHRDVRAYRRHCGPAGFAGHLVVFGIMEFELLGPAHRIGRVCSGDVRVLECA
ncbi:MAG TPA: hypothetical protein VE980_24100 [Pyrinomonadaceae bacterium]|nr:hypothetical protein [Pyrinomonadaceae bacterium]